MENETKVLCSVCSRTLIYPIKTIGDKPVCLKCKRNIKKIISEQSNK